jgi:hypothetical protein
MCLIPLSLAEIPQVQAFQTGLKRRLGVRRVLALATERRLICCWQHKSLWYWRSIDWPPDACRDGMPMQREVMSEALEELLFDSDVVGARLELLLPVDGVYWRAAVPLPVNPHHGDQHAPDQHPPGCSWHSARFAARGPDRCHQRSMPSVW